MLAFLRRSPATIWRSRGASEQEPLDAVVAYVDGDTWHYVTQGLGASEATDFSVAAGLSGFGFELTMRVPRDGETPPRWPVDLLQFLGSYVYRSANVLRPGDHLPLRAGIEGGTITALLFARDRSLPTVELPSGSVEFVQVVGVTGDELRAVKRWSCDRFLSLLARVDRTLATDPRRACWMRVPEFARLCWHGALAEGSAQSSALVPSIRWQAPERDRMEIVIGAAAVEELLTALTGRLPFNRELVLRGRRASVHLVPGLQARWRVTGRDLIVEVPWDAAAAMATTLAVRRGRYAWPGIDGLAVVVQPTDVRGERGEIVRVIG